MIIDETELGSGPLLNHVERLGFLEVLIYEVLAELALATAGSCPPGRNWKLDFPAVREAS